MFGRHRQCVNKADAGESEGERPEIRHTEKSDGNPCFGVRGSNRTSTEKKRETALFSAQERKRRFSRKTREENKNGKTKTEHISHGNAGYDGSNWCSDLPDPSYRGNVPDSASDQYCMLGA